MRTLETRLDGPLLLEPTVFRDQRGFFLETYRRSTLGALGIHHEFVQDNHSRSALGVVRGLHLQAGVGQAKLVRATFGSILDVVVDVRRDSPTFGEWEGHTLDDENLRQLYVPVGFAHGFCVTSERADVLYKTSSYYDPSVEIGIAYDDPDVGIEWPGGLELIVSPKDAEAPRLREVAKRLAFSVRA